MTIPQTTVRRLTGSSLSLASIVLALGLLPAGVRAAPPSVTGLFPGGAGRGQTVRVTASGRFSQWPPRVWIDEPGVVFEPEKEQGKFAVHVAPDAVPGLRLVRFHDAEGASPPRPFVIGLLPEVNETEPNDGGDKVQEIQESSVVVNGRLARRGDVDSFALALEAGQPVTIALEAQRRLGSPMDGVLQIVSPDGFVVAQADDSPVLDPVLTYSAPVAGRYTIRVFAFPATPNQSISFAGGDDFLYRLTITNRGYVEQVLPLALGTGQVGVVELLGRNLPSDPLQVLATPTGRRGRMRAWHSELVGEVELPVVPYPCLVESTSTSEGEHQSLFVPGSISGRLAAADEEDSYEIKLKKGQTVRLRIEARTIGSALDPVLTIRDDTGAVLSEQDDSGREGRDPVTTFTPPKDGAFLIGVRDLNGFGGPRHVYRLEATFPAADYDLSIKEDRFILTPGKPVKLAVSVTRQGGFVEPVAIEVIGLPAGFKPARTISEPKGDSAKSATITLDAPADSAPFSGPILILGRAGPNGNERTAKATVTGVDVPIDTLWLTVVPNKPAG